MKANYGIDAPRVIRNLIIAGGFGIILFMVPTIRIGNINFSPSGFIFMSMACMAMALWMYIYSKYGKLKHRDRIISLIEWNGSETVLDVGTGRGLMAIAAAKQLTTGKSIGIDIWNAEDLTNNQSTNALLNAKLEGVEDKFEVLNCDAQKMSFDVGFFDAVLSNQCLHNIYNQEGRELACSEIARVLKAGGIALISDFKHMNEYERVFIKLGFKTKMYSGNLFTAFPPLKILKAIKP